jgi:hypothetical protein
VTSFWRYGVSTNLKPKRYNEWRDGGFLTRLRSAMKQPPAPPKKAKERQKVKRNKNDIFCKSHQ